MDLTNDNVYMQAAIEAMKGGDGELSQAHQYLLQDVEILNRVVLDQNNTLDFDRSRAAFLQRMKRSSAGQSAKADLLGSPLAAAVVVQHLMQYSYLPNDQRPNHKMCHYLLAEIAYQHVKNYMTDNPKPTVQGFYTHMEGPYAVFGLEEAQRRTLSLPKSLLIEPILKTGKASPESEFVKQVRAESKFDCFMDTFEPIFEQYQAEFRAGPAGGGQRQVQKRYFDHNLLDAMLGQVGLSREELTRAFQFEEWFYSHFVNTFGELQDPDRNWHSMIMHILSTPTFTPFARLKPNSILGILVMCGRITYNKNPNYIPPGKYIDWDGVAVLGNPGINGTAQSKGEAVVRVMDGEGDKLGMTLIYRAKNAAMLMSVMNWLTEAADPSTQTPFGYALQHYATVVHNFEKEAKEREEEAAKRGRLEAQAKRKAQFLIEEEERKSLITVEKQCAGCDEMFTWVYPKGLNADSYVNVVKEGELDLDLYCKGCQQNACMHCKGCILEQPEELHLRLCLACQTISCMFCHREIKDVTCIAKKVCSICYPVRVCNCGNLVPFHNLDFRLCKACNVCTHPSGGGCVGNGSLATASEQSLRVCNLCLELME